MKLYINLSNYAMLIYYFHPTYAGGDKRGSQAATSEAVSTTCFARGYISFKYLEPDSTYEWKPDKA